MHAGNTDITRVTRYADPKHINDSDEGVISVDRLENRMARMQHEKCNEMIGCQDTRAKGGVTGQRSLILLVVS